MNKIMNWLLLSCKTATELVEKKSLRGLSRKENVRLKIHTAMCNSCTNYQEQSLLIDKILYAHLQSDTPELIPDVENSELKERLISNLKE